MPHTPVLADTHPRAGYLHEEDSTSLLHEADEEARQTRAEEAQKQTRDQERRKRRRRKNGEQTRKEGWSPGRGAFLAYTFELLIDLLHFLCLRCDSLVFFSVLEKRERKGARSSCKQIHHPNTNSHSSVKGERQEERKERNKESAWNHTIILSTPGVHTPPTWSVLNRLHGKQQGQP